MSGGEAMAEPPFTDPRYLRGVQYRDATNLNARIALHRLFSVNRQGWMRWLFDRLLAAAGTERRRVFEIGCGPGGMWAENRRRIPEGWSLTLSDASAGMVAQAAGALRDRARFVVCDAASLPFGDACFDVVIANHVLYHVGDRRRALDEIRRLLAPGGCLVASTVGDHHLCEIDDRLRAAGVPDSYLGAQVSAPFTLENGAEQIGACFDTVEVAHYEDGLRVTQVEPLIAYVRSMTAGLDLSGAVIDGLRAGFAGEIGSRGFVWVTKASGVFVAR